jgi:magnesium transporter
MIWYLLVCSLIGGLSVSVTTGLGAAIVTTVMGDNQVGFSIKRQRMCRRA